MEDSIRMISSLVNERETLEHEKVILSDDLTDANYDHVILNIRVDNLNNELRTVQEELSLATIDRLKLKDKSRQVRKHVAQFHSMDTSAAVVVVGGVKSLRGEVDKLKGDLSSFAKSQTELMEELEVLNHQLVIAENNVLNIDHFKFVIERHLQQYKERNARLESHLRVIYSDLTEMEGHSKRVPRQSAKVLLETLDLHHYFQSLDTDLKNTETQNKSLKEDRLDLMERCNTLEKEKQVNTVSSEYIQDSMVGQHTFIAQLEKEKETLVYEKERLQTKMSLFKDDKKRMLDDLQRMSQSLGATTRYNRELEAKLQSFKVDLSDMENRAYAHADSRGAASSYDHVDAVNAHASDLLCTHCREKVDRKFLGISKNTQLLGDELLDCITDNLSLETAIFTFLEQKTYLEQDVHHLQTEFHKSNGVTTSMKDTYQKTNTHSSLSNHSETTNNTARWSGSQFSIDSDISAIKR